MKKKLILGLGIFYGTFLQAQTIEETTFTEKNKTMQAFGFDNPVCNQDVLINTWKNFIKKQGGKVKGGIINKASGFGIQFSSSADSWNGYFAYNYNEDNTIRVFTSFQNMQGDFLTSKAFPGEMQSVKQALEEFQLNVQKDCNQDDLNQAKSYNISLSKEKIRNSDKIMFLEKSIQTDQQKVDLSDGKNLPEKDQQNIDKLKQHIISNQTELQALKDRNNTIDTEISAQNLVIQQFQERKDSLEGKTNGGEISAAGKETSLPEKGENKSAEQQENTGKYFDR